MAMQTTAANARQVVVVTGAGSGVGRAVALRLANERRAMLLHTRSSEADLERVASDVRERGATASTFVADLATAGTARDLVDQAAGIGLIDAIVHAAGFSDTRPIGKVSRTDFDYANAAIAGGFFELCTEALPHLSRSQGSIVAISSFIARKFGNAGLLLPTTAAAKASLEALARSFAVQTGPLGVRVNVVAPGYIRKDDNRKIERSDDGWRRILDQIPVGRLGDPDDVAGVVAFLIGSDARYVTGQVIAVDGGLTI